MDSLQRDEGLLDIDLYVKKLHEILMKNTKMVTPPGEFSVLEHMAKGTTHVYPRFFTTGEVYERVLGILDTFNQFYVREKKTSTIAQMICRLLATHHFGDGNGRMYRLIGDHVAHHIVPQGRMVVEASLIGPMESFQKTRSKEKMASLLDASQTN